MASATIGIGAVDSAIFSVVRETISDEAEVQFVAKLLRQVFVDGKAASEVTKGRCVSTDRIETLVHQVKKVLETTAVDVKEEIGVKQEIEEPTSEMDVRPLSDDELSLELGLEDSDTTTGSSAAVHSPPVGQPQPDAKSFGKAVFTPDGCVAVESKRYPGVAFQFRAPESRRGRRPTLGASYHCTACVDLFKSWSTITWRPIFVANGEITGRDPDCAGTNYGHLCQQPERVVQLKAQLAERRLSGRKRSAPARLHDAPKPGSTDGDHNASAATTPQKHPASSKPSGPPRKRRRETSNKATNDETPRLWKRSRPLVPVKSGNALGQLSNNAQYMRQVKAELAEMKDNAGKAEEPDHVNAPPEEKEVRHPLVASKGHEEEPAAAISKAAAYTANFGMAVKTMDPSVVQYENIFGDTYTFKLVQEKQVTKDGVVQTVRTYRCQGCMDVKNRDLIKGDVPLVKTIDGVFVERDPDQPLGNQHLCIS